MPDRPAIDSPGATVSYGELERQSNRLANFLLAAGMQKGTPVAIVADDAAVVIGTILGLLKAGGVFVPLDARLPQRRLRALVAEVSPRWFVAEQKFAPLVGAIAEGIDARRLFIDGAPEMATVAAGRPVDDFAACADTSRPRLDRDGEEAAYVYFTSGSTGQPKGITGRLKAIDHYIRWETTTFGIGADDRVSQLTTPSFDASLRDYFAPLVSGGTVCVPPAGTVLDAQLLVEWLDGQRVTIVHCVPSVFRTMLNEGLDRSRFPRLRAILMAGEAILPADAAKWFDIFGDRIELVNLYGPSETTMTKFYHRVTREDAGRSLIPIGKPMSGAAAIIADDQGNPCPAGVIGEIQIRTPYRSRGYFGRDDLTRAVFVPNKFGSNPDDLVYMTGDLGRMLPDGTFELLGRRDHQVKIRGERVELGAIETALRTHPAVRDVTVVDREDRAGARYLVAYVVLGDAALRDQLRDHLAADLPPVMIPSAFVVLETLPRLLNGKIDRAGLPAPEARPRAAHALAAPRTPVEAQLAALFCDVLGAANVGIDESFFELGGHSLLATQLVSRARRTFNVAIPVRALFDTPTIAGFAAHVDALRWAAQGAASPAAGRTEIEL